MSGGLSGAGRSGAGEWAGRSLGSRTVPWTQQDVILYALAVGATPDELDLVFERDLVVLPTFGLTLAQWAPDVLGSGGAFGVGTAVHGSQDLVVHNPLPTAGEIEMHARVGGVWDKGAAAVFEVVVECDAFTATWGIFAPGCGGFGGERGPGRPGEPAGDARTSIEIPGAANRALLYRLLGDHHHIHVDPEAAAGIGQPRPILHGLATLGASALAAARGLDAPPETLVSLSGRFAAVAFPDDDLVVDLFDDGAFTTRSPQGVAIQAGHVAFA